MINVLLTAHFLGDFYFQNKKMSDSKTKFGWLILHSFIYSITVMLFFSAYRHNWWQMLIVFGSCFLSHTVIDKVKVCVEKNRNAKTQCLIYVLDQLLHIVLLIVLTQLPFIDKQFNILGNTISTFITSNSIPVSSGLMLSVIVVMNPTSLFVTKVFACLTYNKGINNALSQNEDSSITNAGMIIGFLERLAIVILCVSKQYGLIGLFLTVKSIARFKQFDHQDFTEKFIIGTLLSLSITILTLFLCNCLTE